MRKRKEFWIGILAFLIMMGVIAVFFIRGEMSPKVFLALEILLILVFICVMRIIILPYGRLLNYVSLKEKEEERRTGGVTESEAEPMLRDIQLALLSEQINPHFLYNTLESIRGLALHNDDFIVADMAETLGTFFRYSISRKGNVVTLSDEIRNVQIYLKIQQFRFQNNFALDILMDDEQIGEYQMPKLTLQPIVENSLVHGLDTSREGGCIVLRVIETQDRLILNVKDNGRGIPTEKLEKQNSNLSKPYYMISQYDSEVKGGMALYNINNRLKLMYGEKYGIQLFSTEGIGTEVQITLPKMKKEKEKGIGNEKGIA